jgi:hypothetical protein
VLQTHAAVTEHHPDREFANGINHVEQSVQGELRV